MSSRRLMDALSWVRAVRCELPDVRFRVSHPEPCAQRKVGRLSSSAAQRMAAEAGSKTASHAVWWSLCAGTRNFPTLPPEPRSATRAASDASQAPVPPDPAAGTGPSGPAASHAMSDAAAYSAN